jgi:ElaB/YqjD/DUF883 family membrane-anchored ribosome-binding protein
VSNSSTKGSSNGDSIEERKKEIESELDQIQEELDRSFDDMREDVSRQFAPKEFIKRHPLASVGVSMLAGFFFGTAGRSTRSRRSRSQATGDKDNLTNMLWDEIKSTASKKAVSMLVDYVDKSVQKKLDEIDPTRFNGEHGSDEDQ